MIPTRSDTANEPPDDTSVPLEAILCTDELERRPSRAPDYQTENRALSALVKALADSPSTIFQTLADTILEVFQVDSAGLSVLATHDSGRRFYWPAIAGAWKAHVGGGTPRDFGPSGDVLERNAPLLFKRFERRYRYLLPATPPAEEALLVPFYVHGKAVGTIWAMAHDEHCRFDAEDLRQLESLGRFASAAYQAVESQHAEDSRRAAIEQVEQQAEALAEALTMQEVSARAAPTPDGGLAIVSRDITERKLAEEKVSRLARQLQLVTDAMPALISYIDAQCRYRFNNKAYLDWFGLEREQLLGKHMSEVLGESAFDRLRPHVEGALAGRRQHFEDEVPYKEGGKRHIQAEYMPDLRPDGSVAGFYVLVTDVTARKRSEKDLYESESRNDQQRRLYEAILANTPDLVYVFDLDHRFIYANQVLLAMWGRTWDQAIGKTCLELGYEPWHAALHDREIEQVIATRQPIRGEVPFAGTFGLRTYDYIFVPVLGANGEVEAIAGTTRDVTDRKEAEKSLREGEERFRMLAENMSQFAWTADAKGWIYWYNQRWYDYTGTTLDEMQGWGWKSVHHPDHVDRVVERLQRSWDTGEQWEDTFPLRGKDGRYRWFLSRALPIRDDKGNVLRWFGTNTDITEQRELAEELRKSLSELALADRRKDEFLATLAHELRNPLAPIRNALEILRLTRGDGEMAQLASAMMERQVSQMVRLVDDLLDVSRISRGRIELRRAPVDLASVVRDAVEAVRPACESKGLELTVALPSLSPVVSADASRLVQVLGNLLNNACKFTDRGGQVALAVERHGEEVVIRVRDTGIGIAAEAMPSIFDMFVQADTSLERSASGLGIGLTLVKDLVELHGGTVQARSAGAGLGSEFEVRLPIGIEAPVPAPANPHPAEPVTSIARRVLVVDDNRDAAESLALVLQTLGHETRLAHDGLDAVHAALVFRPELVLLDIGLPKLNGYDAARRMREQPWGRNTTLIALSGWGQDGDREKARQAGFDAHMVKPVDYETLMKALADLPAPQEQPPR